MRCWLLWWPRPFGCPPPPPPAQAQEATANCGDGPLDGRTQKVVDAILSIFSSDCSAVTSTHLAAVSSLAITNKSLSSLQSDDFEGLSELETLDLFQNDLTDLPEGVLDGLTSLEILRLNNNSALGALPPEVFDGLSSLEELYLTGNTSLACIHPGQFDGLSALRELHLSNTRLGNIAPTPHASRWGLNKLEELNFGNTSITGSDLSFQSYRDVFPALVESRTRVTSTAVLSDPICGSIAADADGSGFHTMVEVRLEHSRVYPNRVVETGNNGDGFCYALTSEDRRVLWTWQRSDDGVTFTDMPSDRQPPDYALRAGWMANVRSSTPRRPMTTESTSGPTCRWTPPAWAKTTTPAPPSAR